MSKNSSPLRSVVNFISCNVPSAAALRDFLLILLAWSMFTPTLALAGAVGAKTAGLMRTPGANPRAQGATPSGPPSDAASKAKPDDARGGVGTDFWLLAPASTRGGASSVLLAGDADAEGAVSGAGFEKKFEVGPGRATSVEVPPAASGDAGAKGANGERDAADAKDANGVVLHVRATGAVSAAVLQHGEEGARAYMALPSAALGTEYIAVGGGGREAGGRSRLFVLATADSTTVTINPAVAAEGHAAGESYSVRLDAGAVYQLAEDAQAGGDLTGTVVSSDQPVAAFVGYEGAGVARGAGWFAQLPPTESWGSSFVATPSGGQGARVRVVAASDGTRVTVDGAEVATIDRGRSYEQTVGSHALVSSDKPVLVALRDGESDSSDEAASAPLVLVTPAERYAKTYTFATPSDGFDSQHLNVVVPAGANSGLTLDGAPVAPSAYASIGEGRFSVATLDVRGGAHRLSSATPFGVVAYGSGGSSRYAYSVNANLAAAGARGKNARAANTLNATAPSASSVTDCGDLVALVRHAPNVNGRIEGSVQMLAGEYLNLNSGNVITSDLFVPGTPSIQINGAPSYQGTVDGTGSAQPTGYGVTINSGAQLRHVVRRTNPVTLTSVPVPPSATGTRSVTINSPGQSAGTWATVRDLTLNSGVGQVAVPAGTYNNFTANDGSYLVFGVAGATTPAVYNFDTLTLNSNSALRLVGPVRINVASRVNVSSGAVAGYDQNPRWMELNVARYDVTVNSLGALYGVVRAPAGAVNVNGRLRGSVESDRLSVNGGASLEWMGCAGPANQAPAVSAGPNQTIALPNTAALAGSASDDGLPSGAGLTVTWSKASGPGAVTFANANAASTTASFGAAGTYVLRLTASDTQLTSTSDVTVTVNPENHAPQVDAGADSTVAQPNAATLAGSASDDGLPTGAALTSQWTVVSGPGSVAFADANSAATTATFSAPGAYVLRLTASDTQLSASDDVAVTVDPRNVAPTVDAGADQSIELPNAAALSGGVNDDGYPRGAALTHAWSTVSGPAPVSFANANALSTNASFAAPGTYTLRLTANDTEFTVADDLVVNVRPQNQAPTASAGPDVVASLGANLLRNAGAEDALVEGRIPFWTADDGAAWGQGAPGTLGLPFGFEGATYFYPAALLDTELRQDVDVSAYASLVDAGTQQFEFRGYVRASAGLPADGSRVIVEYRDASGVVLSSFDSGVIASAGAWAVVSDARVAPAGTRALRVRLLSVKANAQPGGGLFDGLSLRATGAAAAPLDGSASDDGQPAGGSLSVAWSKVSGPGEVRFTNAASAATVAAFDAPGAYVLRLTASDSVFSTTDDVNVNVARSNLPPVVSAGAGAGAAVSQPLSLNGTATDDALPAGSALTYAWSKASGPGSAAFASNTSAATTVTFDAPGVYVLRLAVGDSEYVIADELAVTVEPANAAPAVNAGADQTVSLPNPAALAGSVSDDGLPHGAALTVEWSKVSGPGEVGFADAHAAATTASFGAPGTYVLKLSASDTELTGEDELTLTVAGVNLPPTVGAGTPQTITLPSGGVSLDGSVTDDGLPVGSRLTSQWSVVGAGPAVAPDYFGDDFEDGVFSTSRWGVIESSGGAHFAEQNGRLELIPGETGAGHVDMRSNGYMDMRERSVSLKVGGFDPATGQLMRFIVRDDGAATTIMATIASNSIQFFSDSFFDGQTRNDDVFVYDNTRPVWLRWRQSGDFYFWDTSLDGVNWTTRVEKRHFRPPTTSIYLRLLLSAQRPGLVSYFDDLAVRNPAWDANAGPGSVSFADASSPATTASFTGPGVYRLRLTASDSELSSSGDVTVTVNPENHAPTVDAGLDQTVLVSETAHLTGRVGDDALPTGSSPSYGWAVVSGPGQVNLSTPNAARTDAAFSVPGYYVLRLTASDTQLTASDDVTVRVVASFDGVPGGVFVSGHDSDGHSAGEHDGQLTSAADRIIQRAIEYVSYKKPNPKVLLATDQRFPGADNGDSRRALSRYNLTVADYGSGQEGALDLHTVNFKDYDVLFVASSYGGWLRQDELDILNARRADVMDFVNQGGGLVALAESGGRLRSDSLYPGVTRDHYRFLPIPVTTVQWQEDEHGSRISPEGEAMGLTLFDYLNSTENYFTTTGGMDIVDYSAAGNITSLAYRGRRVNLDGSVNESPVVYAGPDRTVTLPNAAALAGAASDDALPAGSSVSVHWTVTKGPGAVNFENPDAAATRATFAAPGVYTLRLTGTDGLLESYSETHVTVNPAGQFVVVDAGPDQTVRLPKTAALKAAVTDGRVSQDSPPALLWEKVSGPGAVTFSTPNALATTASFASAGVYVIRFSAGDAGYTGSDELTVTVRPVLPFFGDDFDDNTNDPLKWYYGPGVGERDQQLQMDVPGSAPIAEFVSAGTMDMTPDGAYVRFEMTDYADPSLNNRNIYWRMQASEGHWFQWVYHNGAMEFYLDNIFLLRDSYAANWRYWRIIHYADHDRVNFDTSMDGQGWLTHYSLVGPYSFALDKLTFRLIAGTQTSGGVGAVKIDNVNTTMPYAGPNHPPTPVPGGPYRATVGQPLQFDGSRSADPDDFITEYLWDFGDGTTAAGPTPTHTYASVGTYAARLTVKDPDGSTGTTTTQVLVTPPNQPPAASAGADQTVRLPAAATLAGSVSDDGLPEGATLTSQWTVVSGPGSVAFADASSPATTASFAADGTYVLRLTASDTELSASDDVTVTVEPAPPNQPPAASAGADQTATPGLNLVRNGGGEEQVVGGLIPGWTKAEGTTWAQAPAGTSGFYESLEGDTYLHAPGDEHAELRQDVDVSAFAGSINAGAQQFAFSAAVRAAAESAADGARVVFEFRDASNANVLATVDSGEINTTETWQLVEGSFNAPAGSAWLRVRLIAARNSGATTDAYFDAVSVRAVGNAAVKLDGAATDDGLPAGAPFSSTWTVVSGTSNGAAVTFADAHAASTAASFSAPGEYVLRLTASDTAATVFDEMTVNVTEANRAPEVSAGVDQTITLPATTALVGTVNDDALPQGRGVSTRWRKVAGPGAVTFSDASSAATDVSFSEAGNYVLRLTADDTDMGAQDDIVVTVKRAPVNQAPLVEAGLDQSVSLPGRASLTGQAADDGRPSGSALTYAWSKSSGPGSVSFSAPSSLTTTAAFSAEGVYVLRLTASDSELSTSDELTVTVAPQGTNSAPNVTAGPDQEVRRPDAVTLYGNATDDGLPSGSTLSATWAKVSGPGAVNFASPNAARTDATFDAAGTYVLRLTASDTELSASDDVTVTVYDEATGDAPTVELLSPADGEEVTAPKDVVGSVSGGAWRLEYAYVEDEAAPAQGWRTFAAGSGAVTNGVLGRLDPTLLLNGTYSIRLSSTDTAGRTTSDSLFVVVARQMKVGNFTISFDDLSVPVAGIPIRVTRTYDSRDKRVGDFGVGWALSIASARVQKTVPVGSHWFETRSFAAFSTYCLESTRPQIVTVTFGDGKVYRFKAEPAQRCQRFQPFNTVEMVYTPMPGTRGKLAPLNGGSVIVAGSVPGPVDIVDINDPSGYYLNPSRFRLTTEDGTSFVLDQKSGVESVTIPSGESLSITGDGVTHSSGASVQFVRDSQGRIKEMRDPAGRSRFYAYDPNGDLKTFRDAEGATTTFTYAADHYLTGIEVRSADGTSVFKPVNNEYVEGRLVRQLDADGREIKYEHDAAARREVIRDRLGNPTTYEYDERGNVVRSVDARGGVKTFTYDADDNMLTSTNALGKTTTYTYDSAGRRASETDPLGNVTRYTHNALGQVLTTTDALGRVTTNAYDEQSGNLLSTRDPDGNETRYEYQPLGSLRTAMIRASKDDPAHPLVTRYAYDRNGDLTSETDPSGAVASYTYDAAGNRLSQTLTRTRPDGTREELKTSYELDGEYRVTKMAYADGTSTTVTYNELGKQSSSKDQLGRETKYEYDSQGRLTRTTFADGRSEESSYDAEGRRTRFVDVSGQATTYLYDELGRLVKTTYSDNTFTSTAYDAIGRVTSATDARGNKTTYEYDPNCGCSGRKSKVTDALGHATTFSYDGYGNQTSMTDARGHTTRYEYDALNRRTKSVYDDGTAASAAYDAWGRVVSKTDQAGRVTRYEYDGMGRLTKVTDALGQETGYTYDAAGNQLTQTDALGHTTRYEYDEMGRRTRRVLPAGQSESYAYDAAGRVASKTDFRAKTTTYTYDLMGRLLAKTPDPSLGEAPVSFTYSASGQRETMTDSTGVTTYAYDARQRLKSKMTPRGTLSYTYDPSGNLLGVRSSNPNGVSVDYTYDELNRLSAAKDNRLPAGADTTAYSYDAVGNLEAYLYPNAVRTSHSFDGLNRLTGMSAANASSTVAGYTYALGAAGNRLSVAELSGRAVSYAYDAAYRMTGETATGDPSPSNNGELAYTYDAVGNRLTRTSTLPGVGAQTFTYDPDDRAASDSYDAAGNTTATDGGVYGYDFENRLVDVNGGAVRYAYDGDGNRVSKTVGGVTTSYLVDTNNLTGYAQVAEELQGGQVVRAYTYGLDLISQRRPVAGQWASSYYGYDGHGSVRFLTDSSGSVTDTYTYDAFGTLVGRTGSTPNEYLYSGERLDPETGFYYLRARYMSPASGRFMSMDLVNGLASDPRTLHKYLYVSDDPANKVDPSGLFGMTDVMITSAVLMTLSISAFAYATYKTLHHLPSDAFKTAPDAAVVGYQVSASLSAAALRVGLGPVIAAGLAITQGVGGVDILIPFTSPRLLMYGYVGGTFGLDAHDVATGGLASLSLYGGLMWNVKTPSDYEGPFYCTSLTTSSADVTRWGFPVAANVQICSSKKDDNSPGAYGFTVNLLGKSSARIASSIVKYYPATDLGALDMPGLAPTYQSINGLAHNLIGY